MRKIREVLRLSAAGHGQRAIAQSVRIGRSTVGDCLGRARVAGITWPTDLDWEKNSRPLRLECGGSPMTDEEQKRADREQRRKDMIGQKQVEDQDRKKRQQIEKDHSDSTTRKEYLQAVQKAIGEGRLSNDPQSRIFSENYKYMGFWDQTDQFRKKHSTEYLPPIEKQQEKQERESKEFTTFRDNAGNRDKGRDRER